MLIKLKRMLNMSCVQYRFFTKIDKYLKLNNELYNFNLFCKTVESYLKHIKFVKVNGSHIERVIMLDDMQLGTIKLINEEYFSGVEIWLQGFREGVLNSSIKIRFSELLELDTLIIKLDNIFSDNIDLALLDGVEHG